MEMKIQKKTVFRHLHPRILQQWYHKKYQNAKLLQRVFRYIVQAGMLCKWKSAAAHKTAFDRVRGKGQDRMRRNTRMVLRRNVFKGRFLWGKAMVFAWYWLLSNCELLL